MSKNTVWDHASNQESPNKGGIDSTSKGNLRTSPRWTSPALMYPREFSEVMIYTEDVNNRRKAWTKLATKRPGFSDLLKNFPDLCKDSIIDKSKVSVTNSWITSRVSCNF